jgi:hypothetical protein
VAAPVRAVGKDLTGIIGQGIWASSAIIDTGRGDRNFFNEGRVCIGPDMGPSTASQALRRTLEAMNSGLSPFGEAQQPYWVSSVICPRAVLLDDGVCDDKEFSHSRSDCNLGRFRVTAAAS